MPRHLHQLALTLAFSTKLWVRRTYLVLGGVSSTEKEGSVNKTCCVPFLATNWEKVWKLKVKDGGGTEERRAARPEETLVFTFTLSPPQRLSFLLPVLPSSVPILTQKTSQKMWHIWFNSCSSNTSNLSSPAAKTHCWGHHSSPLKWLFISVNLDLNYEILTTY